MNPGTFTAFDIQVVITAAVLLAFGAFLAVLAIKLYGKNRELLSLTSKSEAALEKKIKAKTKNLSILHDLTTLISQTLKVEDILKAAIKEIIETAGADAGGIHIIDESRSFLNIAASENLPAEIFLRVKRIKMGEGLASSAIQRKAVIGIEASKYPNAGMSELVIKHGFKYLQSIPIVFKNSALGAISVAYKKSNASMEDEDTLSLLRAIGMEIGVALNNAMLFEKVENAKKEWETTFDSVKDPVYLHDRDCRIIRCNKAFMEYADLGPAEIIGKEYFRIFPKTGGQLEACFKAMESGTRTQEEITDADTGRVFLMGMYPVIDKKGKYIFSVHSAKDITEIKQAKEDLESLFIGTITSLASAIDAKSPWTKGHSERVTYYAKKIGVELGLGEKEIEALTLAGLLHDIGKLGTYDSVLDKPDRLTDEEFELVKKHPAKGAEILAPIKQLQDIIPIIKHHHERYDGRGYPDRLKGEDIPLCARILCAADSFDAMTAERPYKPSRSMEHAKVELEKCSGTHFDPKVVEAFLKVIGRE